MYGAERHRKEGLTGNCEVEEQLVSIAGVDQVVHDVDTQELATYSWRCVLVLEAVQSASLLERLSIRRLAVLRRSVMVRVLVR